ncbi:hypothetical protein [Halohasta litchfieldiae]|jgi:hypothetical protein|uniref:Uncharacterized protein n=1 Tax=Halohasta litchfieldiae TaxID=1073996 RepID=A0A1H6UV95_9EURY|nr:hypothetical protein [Halohasta litchfieldiae]SEI94564.1 hypothetical protein SAMN05444271_1136 [Halohasta litchfieldiae]
MSVDNRNLGDAQSERRTLDDEYAGLGGRLKRYFDTWSRLYIKQQVEARTGRQR